MVNLVLDSPLMSTSKPYFHQLDALRGIACLMVLFHHLVPGASQYIAWGPLGVRLFFVLTGFLLVGNFLQQKEKGIDFRSIFKSFYQKRAVRILPIYLLAFGIVAYFNMEPAREIWVWVLTFTTNFYMGIFQEWAGVLSHYWFLAASEQMVLILLLFTLFVPRRFLVTGLVIGFIGAWLHRWVGTIYGLPEMWIWYSPFSSWDSMAMGALMGIFYRERKEQIHYLASSFGTPLLAWFLLGVACGIRAFFFQTSWIHLAETLEALFFGWLIIRTAVGFTGYWEKILSFPFLVYTGTISYGLYIFHPLVHSYVQYHFARTGIPNDPSLFGVIGATFFLTYLISTILWFCVEKPLISRKAKS